MIGWEFLEPHPLADLFPMLSVEELSDFADRIEREGYDPDHPIVTFEGKILDGRNRWTACDVLRREGRLKSPPSFREFAGESALAFVLRENLHRRHLNESQRGMVAARLATMRRGDNQYREVASIEATSQKEAAEKLNVSRSTVQRAVLVEEKAPDLLPQIESGALTLYEATKEIKRRERPQTPAPSQASVPTGKFDLIYADPPWRYEFMRVDNWAVENTYPTMAISEIQAMRCLIDTIAARDCLLYLWATSPKLDEALQVMRAWGFEYRTSMVWVKHENKAGMGYWVRVGHELLLIGMRGQPKPPPPELRPPSVIRSQKGGHSEKPEEMYSIIEAMHPTARRVELFARSRRAGWDAWGNEVPR